MPKPSRLRKEGGFLISLELIFIATCMLCAIIAGWAAFGGAIHSEMRDLGAAAKALNQSYATPGVRFDHFDGIGFTFYGGWAESHYLDLEDGFCDVIVTPVPVGITPADLSRP